VSRGKVSEDPGSPELPRWRFSQVVLVGATAGLLYLVSRPLLGRPAALFAAVALGCGQVVIAFARIGCNNLHCLFWQVVVVGLLLSSSACCRIGSSSACSPIARWTAARWCGSSPSRRAEASRFFRAEQKP